MDIYTTKKVSNEIVNLKNALQEMHISIDEILSGVEEFGRAEQILVEHATHAQKKAVCSLRFLPYYRERREKATLKRKIGQELDNLVVLEKQKMMPLDEFYKEMKKMQEKEGSGETEYKFIVYKRKRMSMSDSEAKEPSNEREATKSI